MIDENIDKYYEMTMGMLVVSIFTFVLGLLGGVLWFDAYIANIVRPVVYPKSIDCEAHKNIHSQVLIEALIKEVDHARQVHGK